jgi:outer membrane protein OmpA-like peptidoglycan-associated protein
MVRNMVRGILFAALMSGISQPASAQSWLKKAKAKVQEKIEQRADTVLTCVLTDQACLKRAQSAHHTLVVTDANGQRVSAADSTAAMTAASGQMASGSTASGAQGASIAQAGGAERQPPGTGAWLNYDFVPGDKVLFFDDFANDRIGDLPSHEDITDGNASVVEIEGTKYLRTTTGAKMWLNLPDTLPTRFTIEATFYNPHDSDDYLEFTVGEGTDNTMRVWCYHSNAGISGSGPNGKKDSHDDATGIGKNDFAHCRFMADGGYVKAYINEQRLGQLNGLVFNRTNKLLVSVPAASDGATLVTDIRIAAGGRPLFDALTASGRVSTHGILFASGSATLEGESTPTLKEIGDMLTAHPDLKLTIEGHTDNVGDAAANQTLSEQRAAAVAQYLEQHFKVDASRLAAKGFGATKPVASNDTPEGRQQNRRVELVKM